ncbi:hypothetical protein V493_08457 [Pseudogymnoascus sp. VKM F-4281 (FW-2241)]|nr:hypothetical protein V493_08457 [Pseudogymnoascus sp. VKM F-4281 (FW-2241)]
MEAARESPIQSNGSVIKLVVGAIWDPRNARGLIRAVVKGPVGGEMAAKAQGQGQPSAEHMTKAPNDDGKAGQVPRRGQVAFMALFPADRSCGGPTEIEYI